MTADEGASKPGAVEFITPIDISGREGKIFILFPCDDVALQRFVRETLSVEPTPGSSHWSGRCFTSNKLGEKVGMPAVVMGLALWGPNPADPRRATSHQVAVLAHECFHVAELLLLKVGLWTPKNYGTDAQVVWEDAAYLLQCVMRRALEALPPLPVVAASR